MKTMIVFALLTLPTVAAAQTVHISADPNPETERCQNHHAAFHANGDVVMVDYHGQWRTFDNGRRLQNGGIEGRSCEVERVMRLTPERRVVWEIRPSQDRSEHGFARQDRIDALTAMPDGGTVLSVSDGLLRDHAHSNLLYIEADGELRWKLRTKRAPKFSMFTPHVGPDGQLFIDVSATNFGYTGGVIQLPGGAPTKLRKSQEATNLARIDTRNGEVLWERAGTRLADMHEHGVVTLKSRSTSPPRIKTRYVIGQVSYDGILASEAATPWMETERMLSAIYDNEHVLMTTRKEHLNPRGKGVSHRTGNLRVFDMDGNLVHTRQLSDGSRLAERAAGAPLRIVSPTSCTRGVSDYRCVTDAVNVITLQDWEDEGAWSRLTLPRGGLVENDHIEATSTPDGLWLSGVTYYGSGPDDAHNPESVTAVFSPDDMRSPIEPQDAFVWKPKPQPKTPAPAPSLTL
ncbi:MAG: hypothetical protein ACQEVA_17440 [Myxococcota bacterium]